ncbi:MAG: NADH-quinone oxidoreductase subunit NuoK [Fimbriimonadaceae bacterium]|jgi:NADH-quinone oxidoreductase subunit K|nr:NADH-quinone oxidoreductase subunit NuoK [Fimbriimonadaceae bacterium]
MLEVLPIASITRDVPITWFLGLGLAMFILGGIGVVTRRNPVIVFMCIELMLNAVNLTFLTFAAYGGSGINATPGGMAQAMNGQMMVIFVMAVAAAEVAVGLGIIMAIFRQKNDVDLDDMSTLRN